MRKSYLQTSGRAKVEHFVWEIPIYQLNLLLGGAFHVENFYLQTQLQRFVWEIPIYKLNWSVSCGKFLFTNSTGAFRVGNFYLQTQLECFPYLQTIYKPYLQTYLQTSFLREKAFSRRAIHGQESFNQTLDFYMPVPENSFFP